MQILKQAKGGVSVAELCREHGMSSASFYKWRSKPKAIRCDNGPEYISHALQCWASNRGIRLDYIQPGKPQQNAYVERYNRTVRHEWLDMHEFETIEEAQMDGNAIALDYNHERPNMAISGITPAMKLEQANTLKLSIDPDPNCLIIIHTITGWDQTPNFKIISGGLRLWLCF